MKLELIFFIEIAVKGIEIVEEESIKEIENEDCLFPLIHSTDWCKLDIKKTSPTP